MASATVDSAATDGGLIRLDSIPIVDIRLLSQSELYSLSRCSTSASDSNRRDDVVVPIIDRSVFNESAGSRKQTYSRLRLTSSDPSSSAASRSRTPHLRSMGASYAAINRLSDPENTEDYQIIQLLKQLFVGDMNPDDLFPVKIEYSNSIPAMRFTSPPPPPSPSNVVSTGFKRKRGRPRKNELLGNAEDLAVEVSVVDSSDVDRLPIPSLNEIDARDAVEEIDREVLNSDGVAVDLAALGEVEHPYWEEIRQRTEGLMTEDELLGFLNGLSGKWASRRKKKRIVDAGEFGSKLPVGWKLLLSIKKKNGHVWLYCRRYISPSGLHFVSCKGVSSYLLSLHGVHDINPHMSAQYNAIVDDADKLISVPIAMQDGDEIENLVSCIPSPPLDLATGNHEIQVVVNAGNLPNDRIEESLCCIECNITFNDRDGFLQHQSSVHLKNRNKNDVRITDGVIIKDGKYECQFCPKTFSERHRYNGHVGTHARFQAKTAGESSQSVHPNSLSEFPTRDIETEGVSKSHNPMEVCKSIANNESNICSRLDKNDERFADLEEVSGNMCGTVKDTYKTNPCSAAEVHFSSNENKSFCEGAGPNDSAAEISGCNSTLQGRRLESSLSHNDTTDSVFDCNDHVEECLLVNNDHHKNDNSGNQTRNELKLDSQKLAVKESVFAIFGAQGNEENSTVSIKEQSHLEYVPRQNVGTAESISTSGSEASMPDKDPTITLWPIADEEKACRENIAPHYSVKCKANEPLSFGICEKESSLADDGFNRHQEMQFGISSSSIQSWNEQENVTKKSATKLFSHLLEAPVLQDLSKSQLVEDDESMYHYEKNDGGVCGRETKVPEFDSLLNFGNGQSSDIFSNSCARLSSDSMTGSELDTRLGVCSPFTSSTDKQLSGKDNMISIFSDTMEERRQDPSESISVDHSGVSGIPGEAYNSTKIYNNPANPSELKGTNNSGKHELSLSFGSLHRDLCSESNNRVEQESYQANRFNVDSVVHKTYGDPTHSSILSSNIASNLEQDGPFGYPNLSFNDRAHETGSSFNVAHPERDWDETGRNKIRATSQNFMISFGNSSLQTSEFVAANGSWRAGQDNLYGGCFDANSNLHIPPSSCLPTFGLAPNKEQESSFGVNNNYSIQSDVMQPSRTQPVEYSFMDDECVNSLAGEAKVFSFDTNMEQGMDSSFWLERDPPRGNGSESTSVCVWCRNVFFDEPMQAGMQTGAIGTICPSCSSNIPGQFNVL